jgi:hypothetical protein
MLLLPFVSCFVYFFSVLRFQFFCLLKARLVCLCRACLPLSLTFLLDFSTVDVFAPMANDMSLYHLLETFTRGIHRVPLSGNQHIVVDSFDVCVPLLDSCVLAR